MKRVIRAILLVLVVAIGGSVTIGILGNHFVAYFFGDQSFNDVPLSWRLVFIDCPSAVWFAFWMNVEGNGWPFKRRLRLSQVIVWTQRKLAWFGLKMLVRPPSWAKKHDFADALMALHRCRICGVTRYDRLLNWLSVMEGFDCGVCGAHYATHFKGIFRKFPPQEISRICAESRVTRFQQVWWRVAGIPLQALPPSRGGQTAGWLETDATMYPLEKVVIENKGRS